MTNRSGRAPWPGWASARSASRGVGEGNGAPGGWNVGLPPGALRCYCPARVRSWARLDFKGAGAPCCSRECCAVERAAITVDRATVERLRRMALAERWACRRCGQPVALHHRGFECVDPGTRAIRAVRQRRERYGR